MPRPAPNFSLPDQDGVIHSLDDYSGRWLVLFFYPKDGSINCTREVCAFRDEYAIIAQFGNAAVVGVNNESIESHKAFALRNSLQFPLLSDADAIITKAYGAWRSNRPKVYDAMFATRRNTYIINPAGEIVKSYSSVSPGKHVQQIIEDLQRLQ